MRSARARVPARMKKIVRKLLSVLAGLASLDARTAMRPVPVIVRK
jgi:hypothetical protein